MGRQPDHWAGPAIDDIGPDFSQLADNVPKARRVAYGEEAAGPEDSPGRHWAGEGEGLHTAPHAGYEAPRDRRVAREAGLRGAKRRQAAEQLPGYVTDRRPRMRMPADALARQAAAHAQGPTPCRTCPGCQ